MACVGWTQNKIRSHMFYLFLDNLFPYESYFGRFFFKILHFFLCHFKKIKWLSNFSPFRMIEWMVAEETYLIIPNLQHIFVDIATHIRITINRNMCVPINFTHELKQKLATCRIISYTLCKYIPRGKVIFLVKMALGSNIWMKSA